MSILRRFVALVVFFIATIAFLAGGVLRTVDSLAGSGQRISDTATSILATTGGSSVVADVLVTNLTKDADPAVKQVMTAKKSELVDAVAATIRNPETLRIASDDFLRYYNAIKTNTAVSINPQLIIWRLTSAMHAVDARIPSNPHDVGDPITYKPKLDANGNKKNAGSLPNESAGSSSIFLLLAGLVITLLGAVFLVRHSIRKLIALGLTIAVPGAILVAAGPQIQSGIQNAMTNQDESAHRLVDVVMARVNSGLTGTGVTLLVAAAVLVGGWVGIRYYRQKQGSPVAAAAPRSETPEPPVANATDDSGVQ